MTETGAKVALALIALGILAGAVLAFLYGFVVGVRGGPTS
jgi:hypothetical protein